ncbi:glucan endo-1,3-beta-glucosidase 8-like [Salvia miltiorrhiza]|uniref:glucan endo-1,3-beta-glucosidase 8-like n=1 Tax=Salvia miltiorrhiza TaxID=226208 RepID=UPI0025AC9E7F|nr:glucan endo-1,3-beta-glucosidase 8-like [Salvia miltiorrhiza]
MGPPIPVALAVVALFAGYCTEAYIGINWGRQSAQRLVPSQVVDLILQNGIRNARIYSTQVDIMNAFESSGVNLTITIYNTTLPHNISQARSWVQWKYDSLNVSQIPSVIIGGGVYPLDLGGSGVPDYDFLWNALNYVQAALNESGLGDRMKTNFLHYAGLLNSNITKPSTAEFRPDIRDRMLEFLQFLRHNGAPFMVEFFPITDLERCGLDPSFAFADNRSKLVIRDVGGAVYTNGFDWQYDCFVWALEKLNASDLKILVMQVGWPTDGYPGANAANAERYYKYLLPMVASNKGTPKQPGAPIDVYVNSLADEPKISDHRPPFMRHWGIYRSNGEPKFKIDLSGRGRDVYPTKVKGIMRMPQRWCVFNGDMSDMWKVRQQVQLACAKGDCTTLAPAASCSRLDIDKNVSYAFNVFFQTHFQDEQACDFHGLGCITDQDPSTDECVFPVEVVRGMQVIDFGAAAAHRRPTNGVVFLFVLYIMGGFM